MTTVSLIFISASVGARGRNADADVRTIQEQLNALMPPNRTRLAVDGKCGPLTIDAIKSFQKVVCGMRFGDGLVEPDRKTIAAMCDASSKAKWSGMAPPPLTPDDPLSNTPPGAEINVAPPDPARVAELKTQHENTPAPPTFPRNLAPKADGEITLFEKIVTKEQKYYRPNLRAIFVNGMLTTGDTHMSHAMLLSTNLRCPVYGVFNGTQSLRTDFFQCVADKLGPGAAGGDVPHTTAAYRLVIDAQLKAYRTAGLHLTRVQFIEALIAGNTATLQLFRALRSGPLSDRSIPIYAHSQGNLITSNALFALALADGDAAVRGRTVESYGSPCRNWPPGIRRRDHRIALDPITLLQLRRSTDSVYVKQSLGDLVATRDVHGFDVYMAHDPDFIINSCRWTVFGFVETIDPAVLAESLVQLGNNTIRIKRVFETLLEDRERCADEVALKYATRQRRVAKLQMHRMINEPNHGKPLLDAMVGCLTSGLWTSKDEEEMAAWLTSLRHGPTP